MITIKKLTNYRGGEISDSFFLHAALEKSLTIPSVFGAASMQIPRQLIPCGIEITMKGGVGIHISGRSGLAAKHGIFLLNSPVITTQNYGELKVVLGNLGGSEFTIHPGDIVAEAKIIRLANVELEVEEA